MAAKQAGARPCSWRVSRLLGYKPSGSWQGGTGGKELGLPLRGRMEDALDEGDFRVGKPIQPESGPHGSRGRVLGGAPRSVSGLISSFLLPAPMSCRAGYLC